MSKNKKNQPTPTPIAVSQDNLEIEKPVSKQLDDTIFRKIFWGLALFLVVFMPAMSFQYGITADEWVYKAYGELCLDYLTSFGEVKTALNYAPKNAEVMYCYGPTVDSIAAIIYRTFDLPAYTVRHIMLSLMGVLLMVSCGLVGKIVGGNWRVALMALLFALFSPRLFGDSMNNPKDITFAAAYMFTLAMLLKLMRELPNPSWRTVLFLVLGVGLGLGSRAPGLILVLYVPFFVVFEIFFRKGLRQQVFENKTLIKNILLKVSVATVGGYLLGIAFWPFALVSPITNPLVALQTLTNFPMSIKTIFEGTKVFSTSIPWYYVPKLMLISTPLYFLLGLLVFSLIFFFVKRNFNQRYLFVVLFVGIFPLLYALYKHSAFYNGWRHTTFVYTCLLVLSTVGYEFLLQKMQGTAQKITIGVVVVLMALPLWFMVKNHPYQYTYFNELIGGEKGAYSKYETDYFGLSTRYLADWLKNNQDLKGKPIIVATDFLNPTDQYFKEFPNVKVQYQRFYQRAEKDWDYGIFLTTRLTPSHFRIPENFPPTGTIYKETVDGVPMGVVIKRPSKEDFKGVALLKEGKFQEATPLLENALKADPNNEVIHLYLANAYVNLGQYEKGLKSAQRSLEIMPEYTGAMTTMAVAYINLGQNDNAIFMLNEALEDDPQNRDAVSYLALCYERKGDQKTADYYKSIAQQMRK